MTNDVIVGVQLDREGRPTLFEVATFSPQGFAVDGGDRFESARWAANQVSDGVLIDTLVTTDGHSVLAGYLTVSDDENGDPVFGIDDRLGAGRTIKDLRRLT